MQLGNEDGVHLYVSSHSAISDIWNISHGNAQNS